MDVFVREKLFTSLQNALYFRPELLIIPIDGSNFMLTYRLLLKKKIYRAFKK